MHNPKILKYFFGLVLYYMRISAISSKIRKSSTEYYKYNNNKNGQRKNLANIKFSIWSFKMIYVPMLEKMCLTKLCQKISPTTQLKR